MDFHTTESRCQDEENWARKIIDSETPKEVLDEYLAQHFLGFDWVKNEARMALSLLQNKTPSSFIFLGSGSMPITAYRLHEYGLGKGIGVDDREICTRNAFTVTEKLGLSKSFSFITANALSFTGTEVEGFDKSNIDTILIGLLVGDSEAEKLALIETCLSIVKPGSLVLCRAGKYSGKSRIAGHAIPKTFLDSNSAGVVEHSDFLTAAFIRS